MKGPLELTLDRKPTLDRQPGAFQGGVHGNREQIVSHKNEKVRYNEWIILR